MAPEQDLPAPADRMQAALEKILAFRRERDWEQFHNPKDLAAGLSIEAAELQELFLWRTGEDLPLLVEEKREAIADELADVGWYLLLLAHDLDIDLPRAIEKKLAKNAIKYPVKQARGNNRKYTELG